MSNNTREALAALPMLPEPFRLHWINCPFESIGLFTAEQMQAYARAALATQPAQPSAELLILRAEAEALRKALVLVMDYPDVRKYLGSQVANVADAAIAATKEQQA